MISGFSKPWSPVFLAFIIPKYFKKYGKVYGDIFKTYYFYISGPKNCQIWKRRAPKNDEDPSNQIPKIMDVRPISV
jgi:hypothetical protein